LRIEDEKLFNQQIYIQELEDAIKEEKANRKE